VYIYVLVSVSQSGYDAASAASSIPPSVSCDATDCVGVDGRGGGASDQNERRRVRGCASEEKEREEENQILCDCADRFGDGRNEFGHCAIVINEDGFWQAEPFE